MPPKLMYNTFTHCIPSYATFYNGKDPSASTSYDYHIGFKLPSQVHSLLIVYCLTPTDNSLKNRPDNDLPLLIGLLICVNFMHCLCICQVALIYILKYCKFYFFYSTNIFYHVLSFIHKERIFTSQCGILSNLGI